MLVSYHSYNCMNLERVNNNLKEIFDKKSDFDSKERVCVNSLFSNNG